MTSTTQRPLPLDAIVGLASVAEMCCVPVFAFFGAVVRLIPEI